MLSFPSSFITIKSTLQIRNDRIRILRMLSHRDLWVSLFAFKNSFQLNIFCRIMERLEEYPNYRLKLVTCTFKRGRKIRNSSRDHCKHCFLCFKDLFYLKYIRRKKLESSGFIRHPKSRLGWHGFTTNL